MGLRPSLMAAALSVLTSMPTTSWPSAANAADETLPTYPRPKTETLIRESSCNRSGLIVAGPLRGAHSTYPFRVAGRFPRSGPGVRKRSGPGVGKRLNAVAVDERAVPEFQVHERPDGVAAGPPPGTVLVEQRLDSRRVDQSALAGAPIEQDLARHVAPAAADPPGEGNREAHLPPCQDFRGNQSPDCFAQDPFGRQATELEPMG